MSKYLVYSALFLAGVILSDSLRRLPGGNMLPRV